jgi:two-component system nitrate/nitrite response regulator NarL
MQGAMNGLTRREHEVASLAAAGLQVKEIAYCLGITHGTAKVHLHNVYMKLGIGSRVKLALTWMTHEQKT